MERDVVHCYRNHILLPIETFIKTEENNLEKFGNSVTEEQQKVLQDANQLFLEKLKTFCILCDEIYQSDTDKN